ncbi:MAG: Zn-ribbon containing protein [Candidatus Anstonellaceae archaeon]
MHKCVRCDRAATTIQEINDGCPCGSKVFVFIRDDSMASPLESEPADEKPNPVSADYLAPKSIPDANGEKDAAEGNATSEPSSETSAQPPSGAAAQQPEPHSPAAEPNGNGKAPSSYFARMTFTTEDVENIKIVTEGVFAVDVNALSRNPVVLKDQEGVYYVRLPFEQKKK